MAHSDFHISPYRQPAKEAADGARGLGDLNTGADSLSAPDGPPQDLLTQAWHKLLSIMSQWAHKPPSWFPDWLDAWLTSSAVPLIWLWIFIIVGTALFFSAIVIVLKLLRRIAGSIEFRAARHKSRKKMILSPYQARRILTANETEFFGRLRRALTPRYVLFSQVSMSALLEPKPHHTGREYMQLRAKFSQKYVDFVVCDPVSIEVIALIELDDITHDPEKDAKRDEMMEGAGYVTVRWHSRNKPSVTDIARAIDRLAERRSWMTTQPMA